MSNAILSTLPLFSARTGIPGLKGIYTLLGPTKSPSKMCAVVQPIKYEIVATTHESIHILTLGHSAFHTKWMTECAVQSSAHQENLPSPPLSGAVVKTPPIPGLYTHTEPTHL